jgi:putative Ca2+/H+ antiporter (TMEM165/GDT1 family)
LNWPLFASTFALTFVAELPDKTVFATMLLATRRSPWAVFIGAAAAFVVQTVVAVSCGSLLGLLPARVVHGIAGALFLILAVVMWRRPSEEEPGVGARAASPRFWSEAWASFVVIFLAEWGDLTQFSTATLAAKFRAPVTIFVSAVLALWAATALAVLVGNKAKAWIKPDQLQKLAAAAFAMVGVVLLVGAAR